jgi:hypothetical protein
MAAFETIDRIVASVRFTGDDALMVSSVYEETPGQWQFEVWARGGLDFIDGGYDSRQSARVGRRFVIRELRRRTTLKVINPPPLSRFTVLRLS